MSFVRLLGMANYVPEQIDSRSEAVIDKDGDGFSITSVHLTVTAKIPSIDQATFQSIAAKAKAGCPISKLGKVEALEPLFSYESALKRVAQSGSPRYAPLIGAGWD